MRTHVQRTRSRCFAVLRQLRQIRQLEPPTTFQTLVVVLVLSRLDYCNGVLVYTHLLILNVGFSPYWTRLALLIHHMRRSEHITVALVSLHWLRTSERIQYKIAVRAYKVLHGTAARYLHPPVHVSGLPGRRALRSTSTRRLVVPPFKLSTIGSRTSEVTAARTWTVNRSTDSTNFVIG